MNKVGAHCNGRKLGAHNTGHSGMSVCVRVFTKVPIRGLVRDVTIVSEDFPGSEDMNTGPRIQPPLNWLLRAAR